MTSVNWPPSGGGSPSWKDAVANAAALPTGSSDGEARMAIDTKIIWAWDAGGPAWVQVTAAVGAALVANRAVITDGSGALITGAVTDAEVGYLTGLTSNVQTHITDATIHFTEASIDHTAILNVGTNSHAAIDTHIADGTIHFTEASIDHAAILNIGTNTHAAIDTHIADGTIHFTVASIDHTAIANIGTNSHASIDTHIADGTIHFTEGSIDHTAITNIGTNSHAAIDTHIADGTIHFTEGSIDHTAITNIGTNSHAAIDTHIADATIHFTEASIDHTAITNIGTNSHAAIDTHIANALIVSGQVAISSSTTLTNARIHNVDTTAARSLALPAAAASVYLVVKDVSGDAQTNNITITTPGAETIDGAATFLVDWDFGAVTIYSDGTNYFIV